MLEFEKDLLKDVLSIFVDEFQFFLPFEAMSDDRCRKDFPVYSQKIVENVSSPLKTLIYSFTGPNKLINKRYHKLLDYEAALSDVELKSNQTNGSIPRDVNWNHLFFV